MPRGSSKPTAADSIPGVILPGALYRLETAKRILGLGDWAFRQLRREGLPVLRVSGRAFVAADDLIAFIRRQGGPTV